jgi:hypothetical protein
MSQETVPDATITLLHHISAFLEATAGATERYSPKKASRKDQAQGRARAALGQFLLTLDDSERVRQTALLRHLVVQLAVVADELACPRPSPAGAVRLTTPRSAAWRQTTPPAARPARPRKRRARIAVVGLLPNQNNQVQQDCGDLAELFFIAKESAHPQFPAQADAVVLVTRFVNHQIENMARSRFPREAIHLHRGGIVRLVALIKQLAA